MMRTADLWRLQEIDSALDARRATVEDARARLGESDDVAAARTLLEEKIAVHRAAQSAQKDLELQADEVRSKIGPGEQRLYSGVIKNPKELSDLQHDIEQHKRQLSAIEDQDIEALTALEAAEREAREARQDLEALEQAWRQEQAELSERIERLTEEIAGYEAERRDQAADIEPGLLRVYDHVRRAHQGRGVARLDRNLCLGCRISLPTSTVNKARAGNALVQCPNCERILCA
jgi:predicted  nucleic acid-binding Zn-ribbon protein